mgnify:CR=1 FL=1
MQIIQNGGEVKLHATEWIRKSSGRGETELIVDDGKDIQKYSYPYWFPFTSYTDVFPRLFPWAEFSADEDFSKKTTKAYGANITAIMTRKKVCGWSSAIHLKSSVEN